MVSVGSVYQALGIFLPGAQAQVIGFALDLGVLMSDEIRGRHDDPIALAPVYVTRVLGAEYSSAGYRVVGSVAEVRASVVAQSDVVFVPGVNEFAWAPTSTATDNGVTVLQITGVDTGRYLSTGSHYVVGHVYTTCAAARTDATTPRYIHVLGRGPFAWTAAAGTDTGDETTGYIAKTGGGYTFEDRLYADYSVVAATVTPPYKAGRVYYRGNSLNVMTDFSDVTIQVGEELQILAVNDTDATVTNGTVVYCSGGQGQRMAVKPYVNGSGFADCVVGVLTHEVEAHQNCRVTTFGLVRDLDTHDFDASDHIYSSATAATWTVTQPAGTVDGVEIGVVLNSHPTEGTLFVRPRAMNKTEGPTSERPSDPRAGQLYWNTTLVALEVWNGSSWVLV